MEDFNKANAAYIREDYYGALELYNQSIKANGDNADAFAFRAQTYFKMNNFTAGVADAESVIGLASTNYRGYYLKATGNFYLEKFEVALSDFENALEKAQVGFEKTLVQPWVNKSRLESGKEVKVVKEEKKVEEKATPEVKSEKMEVDSTPKVTEVKKEVTAEKPKVTGPVTNADKIKYDWYQNLTHVYIDIKAKNVNPETIHKEITEKGIDLSFPTSGDSDYSLNLDLFDDIIPDQSQLNLFGVKLELKLKKKEETKQWPTLETSNLVASVQNVITTTPDYPTSSKNKKDWSKIDQEIEKDMKKEKPEGDEALNGLFREIYKNADEGTRRAMVKSFQTSGGTVLSTNWDEVQTKDYEGDDRPDPPNGQVWKKDN